MMEGKFKKGDFVIIHDIPIHYFGNQYNGLVAKIVYGDVLNEVYAVLVCGYEDRGNLKVKEEWLSPYVDDEDEEDTEEDCYHDSHYRQSILEPILVMQKMFTKDEFMGFLKGNILKYRLRLGHKTDNVSEELDKIKRYEQWLEEAERGDEITL